MDEIDQTKADSVSDSTDELCDAITIARERLRKYEDYVGGKETRTRVLIIDEILKGLGWDVTDPRLVKMELGDNRSIIDYVLIGEGGEHLGVVEAKRSKDVLRDIDSGIRRGMVSEQQRGDWPQNIWAVDAEGIVYEAQLSNRELGEYHGYPMKHGDRFAEFVQSEWERRS